MGHLHQYHQKNYYAQLRQEFTQFFNRHWIRNLIECFLSVFRCDTFRGMDFLNLRINVGEKEENFFQVAKQNKQCWSSAARFRCGATEEVGKSPRRNRIFWSVASISCKRGHFLPRGDFSLREILPLHPDNGLRKLRKSLMGASTKINKGSSAWKGPFELLNRMPQMRCTGKAPQTLGDGKYGNDNHFRSFGGIMPR